MMASKFKDTDVQSIIGWILRAGVFISMLIVIIGGVFYIYRHGAEVNDYTQFKGVPEFISSPSGIWHGILTIRGRAIIQAGIVLLILTPVLRVVVSGIGFLLEKDYLYTGISLLVLLVIIFSAISGHGG
ncbi:DUF1634 domain-containing protein [Mucilaginibacter koreensis]